MAKHEKRNKIIILLSFKVRLINYQMCLAYQNLSNITFIVLLFNRQGYGLLLGEKEVKGNLIFC